MVIEQIYKKNFYFGKVLFIYSKNQVLIPKNKLWKLRK